MCPPSHCSWHRAALWKLFLAIYIHAQRAKALRNTVRWSTDAGCEQIRPPEEGRLGVTAKEKTDDRRKRAGRRKNENAESESNRSRLLSPPPWICVSKSPSLHARRLGMWDALCGEPRRDNINAPPTTMAVDALFYSEINLGDYFHSSL